MTPENPITPGGEPSSFYPPPPAAAPGGPVDTPSAEDLLGVISGVERQLAHLKQFQSSADSLRAQMLERDQAARERERALQDRINGLEAAVRDAAELRQRVAEINTWTATLEEREQRVTARAGAVAAQIEAFQRQQFEAAAMREHLAIQNATPPQAAPSGQTQAALESMRAQLDECRVGGEALREKLHAAEEELARAAAGRQQAREEADRLTAELASRSSSDAEASQEALRARDEAIIALRVKVDEASMWREQAEAEREEHRVLAESVADERDRLRAELAERDAAGPPAATPGPPAGFNDAGIIARRARLRGVRAALRRHAVKVHNATNALQRRYELCEEVMGQREEIVKARGLLAAYQRKLDKQQAAVARTKTGSAIFFVTMSLAILAGMSWAIAGAVAPATFGARVVIAAENKDGSASDDQLTEWQTYVESQLNDPRLAESTAERMRRRGIETLSTAGQVTARLRADMTHQSPRPGRLRVELKGRGGARTARELETYATAIVSQANASRDMRSDGLATVIGEEATPGPGPLDDQRVVFAGGIFGGLGVLTAVAGLVAWSRLAAAKRRVEEEGDIDGILSRTNWATPVDEAA